MQAETASLDVLGVAEVASLIGVERKTVAAYLARGKLCAPDVRLACGPIWNRSTVEAWLEGRQLAGWKTRLAKLERKHAKVARAIVERERVAGASSAAGPGRNMRARKDAKRGIRRATVSEQVEAHAHRLLAETLEAHADDPVIRKLAAEMDEVNLLQSRIARAEERAFEKAMAA